MSDKVIINWTPEMLERFRKEYQKHQHDPDVEFTFDGHDYVVAYAKYLIQYLDWQMHGVEP